jgi:hypothetical protein
MNILLTARSNNMPHKHAKLMALYAEDAAETDKPWERWEYNNQKINTAGCHALAT